MRISRSIFYRRCRRKTRSRKAHSSFRFLSNKQASKALHDSFLMSLRNCSNVMESRLLYHSGKHATIYYIIMQGHERAATV
jgi:hypothetical protein